VTKKESVICSCTQLVIVSDLCTIQLLIRQGVQLQNMASITWQIHKYL